MKIKLVEKWDLAAIYPLNIPNDLIIENFGSLETFRAELESDSEKFQKFSENIDIMSYAGETLTDEAGPLESNYFIED